MLAQARAFTPAFEAFLWIAMVTGARRGEVCALRWGDIDWDDATLWLRRNYVAKAGRKIVDLLEAPREAERPAGTRLW